MLKKLDSKSFANEINAGTVLVDFYAVWCGPCGVQAKVLEKMKNSRSLNFDIAKVNVDEAPSLAMEYGIDAIPALMIFKNNKLVRKSVGYTEEEEILKMIEEFYE